jgi:hypothetical protein
VRGDDFNERKQSMKTAEEWSNGRWEQFSNGVAIVIWIRQIQAEAVRACTKLSPEGDIFVEVEHILALAAEIEQGATQKKGER